MNVQECLAQLREFSYEPETPEVWKRLVELFELWPDDDGFKVALAYAENFLERWRDQTRVAPSSWTRLILQKKRPHRAWPLVRVVSLSGKELSIRKFMSDKTMFFLARSQCMRRITHVDLSHNQFAPRSLCAFLSSPHTTQIRSLSLMNNHLGCDAVNALSQVWQKPGLVALNLANNHLVKHAMVALSKIQGLSSVERLILTNQYPAKGYFYRRNYEDIAALIRSRHLQSVTHLDLASNSLSTEGAEVVASGFGLEAVESLDLSRNHVGIDGVYHLVGSPHLQQIRHWILRDYSLSDVHRRALRRMFASLEASLVV